MAAREELFDAVWSMPMTALAKRYGVSSSYLARVCDSLDVPRPERGYWAKKEVGRAPRKPELPEARPGDPTGWSPGDGVAIRRSEPRSMPEVSRPEGRKSGRVQTHALVQGASAHFLKSRAREKYGYLKPYKYHLVDITVSEDGLPVALALANALFIALEAKGHRVFLQTNKGEYYHRPGVDPLETGGKRSRTSPHHGLWSPGRLTVANIDGQDVGLLLVEVASATLMRYVAGTYVLESDHLARTPRTRHRHDGSWTTSMEIPSGRLRLVAYSLHRRVDLSEQWEETKASSLVKRTPELVAGIVRFAQQLPGLIAEAKRQMELERQQWEAQRRRQEIQENRRRMEESRLKSREQLDEIIERWAHDRARSEFLVAIEVEIRKRGGSDCESLLGRAIVARELIGSLEPLPRFKAWVAPAERYLPKSFEEEE